MLRTLTRKSIHLAFLHHHPTVATLVDRDTLPITLLTELI